MVLILCLLLKYLKITIRNTKSIQTNKNSLSKRKIIISFIVGWKLFGSKEIYVSIDFSYLSSDIQYYIYVRMGIKIASKLQNVHASLSTTPTRKRRSKKMIEELCANKQAYRLWKQCIKIQKVPTRSNVIDVDSIFLASTSSVVTARKRVCTELTLPRR